MSGFSSGLPQRRGTHGAFSPAVRVVGQPNQLSGIHGAPLPRESRLKIGKGSTMFDFGASERQINLLVMDLRARMPADRGHALLVLQALAARYDCVLEWPEPPPPDVAPPSRRHPPRTPQRLPAEPKRYRRARSPEQKERRRRKQTVEA